MYLEEWHSKFDCEIYLSFYFVCVKCVYLFTLRTQVHKQIIIRKFKIHLSIDFLLILYLGFVNHVNSMIPLSLIIHNGKLGNLYSNDEPSDDSYLQATYIPEEHMNNNNKSKVDRYISFIRAQTRGVCNKL